MHARATGRSAGNTPDVVTEPTRTTDARRACTVDGAAPSGPTGRANGTPSPTVRSSTGAEVVSRVQRMSVLPGPLGVSETETAQGDVDPPALSEHEAGSDLTALLRDLGARPLRVAAAVLSSREAAEDAVQEACIRYIRHLSLRGTPRDPAAFLLTCVVNEARRAWGRGTREVEVVEALAAFGRAPESGDPVASARTRELWGQIQSLPPRQRAALGMRYYLGFTDAEIAELIGCRTSSVRSHISRAIRALRRDEP